MAQTSLSGNCTELLIFQQKYCFVKRNDILVFIFFYILHGFDHYKSYLTFVHYYYPLGKLGRFDSDSKDFVALALKIYSE